jgi:hypothetical protein
VLSAHYGWKLSLPYQPFVGAGSHILNELIHDDQRFPWILRVYGLNVGNNLLLKHVVAGTFPTCVREGYQQVLQRYHLRLPGAMCDTEACGLRADANADQERLPCLFVLVARTGQFLRIRHLADIVHRGTKRDAAAIKREGWPACCQRIHKSRGHIVDNGPMRD